MNGLFEDFDDTGDLAEGLDDPSPGARIMAVIELADIADPSAIVHLAKAITDEDGGVRKQAALALTNFDGPETAAALVGALNDADPEVIEAAAISLKELKETYLYFIAHIQRNGRDNDQEEKVLFQGRNEKEE